MLYKEDRYKLLNLSMTMANADNDGAGWEGKLIPERLNKIKVFFTKNELSIFSIEFVGPDGTVVIEGRQPMTGEHG